jgi:hypothetical protein
LAPRVAPARVVSKADQRLSSPTEAVRHDIGRDSSTPGLHISFVHGFAR